MNRNLIERHDRLRVGGYLEGIAFHRDGMARRERQRVQGDDLHLLYAIREGRVSEEIVDRAFAYRYMPNIVTTVGKGFLVDSWQNQVELETMKFHAVGTGSTGALVGDTALQTEVTTQLNPAGQRATGSLAEGATSNIFRSIGTSIFGSAPPSGIVEWGLFNVVNGAGVMWSRIAPMGAIAVVGGDSIQWTYECTIN